MAIQTLHDTGDSNMITSKYDGGVYQTATIDGVIGGVGDQFTLTYENNSLVVSFSAGSEAVIGGAFFKVISGTSVTLSASSTIYLCANIDLSNANGSRGSFVQRTSSNMTSDNLNGGGTSRDLLLYIIITSASGITSITDKRTIISDAKDVIDSEITKNVPSLVSQYGFSGSYNDLTNIPTNVDRLASYGSVPYTTSTPSSAFSSGGLKIVYCSSEPSTKYSGYIYLIKE